MPTAENNPKRLMMNIRHSPEVKVFVDEKAALNNEFPSAFYRRVFNAGLEAMYGLKIVNNQIVQR